LLKYLTIRTENLWRSTETWEDLGATYEEFKEEIFKLYPGVTGNRTYTMQDLDLIIGKYARISIWNGIELGDYHWQFLLVSWYLIHKNHMLPQEQSRSFF